MKFNKFNITPYFIICLILFIIASCKKDDEGMQIPSQPPVTITTIGGRVMVSDQVPAAFVKLSCNNVTTTTDAKGFYLFKNITVPKARCVIKLENGFFKSVVPKPGVITYCDLTVPKTINIHSFNSTTGGTVTDASGVVIMFQSLSIQKSDGTPYIGSVNASVFYLDPSKAENAGINPVHDNRIMIENTIKYAYSLGSVFVELTSPSGARLNLISQKPATLSIPIATTRLTAIPDVIRLASADDNEGNWKPEGVAQKTGNFYVASVSHFSWWNPIVPLGTAMITGQVKDAAGHPIANATVTETWTYELSKTDQNGMYQFYVPDGMDYEVYCTYYYNMGEYAGPHLTPVLSNAQIYTAPDLIFQNATIINGNTVDCNSNSLFSFATIVDSNGFYNYGIAGNTFSLFAGSEKQVTLLSAQFNQYNQTDLTAGASGTITSAGTLQVCTTAPSSGNMAITFTSPVTGTQTGTLNMNTASVYSDTSNTWSFISLTSIDSLYLFGITNYYIEVWIPVQNSYINSIMSWNHVYTSSYWYDPFVMYGESYNNTYHSFEAIGTYATTNPGSTHITFLGPVGSLVTGSFTGPVDIYDNNTVDIILSGTITGTFSVTRGI